MKIDWDELQKQINDLQKGEKVSGDIATRYANLLADLTQVKFKEWKEKLGPVVLNIYESKKENPEAAAEAIIVIILQIIHYLAQHEVLFEYSGKLNAKMIDQVRALDDRTVKLFQILLEKGVLTEKDMPE